MRAATVGKLFPRRLPPFRRRPRGAPAILQSCRVGLCPTRFSQTDQYVTPAQAGVHLFFLRFHLMLNVRCFPTNRDSFLLDSGFWILLFSSAFLTTHNRAIGRFAEANSQLFQSFVPIRVHSWLKYSSLFFFATFAIFCSIFFCIFLFVSIRVHSWPKIFTPPDFNSSCLCAFVATFFCDFTFAQNPFTFINFCRKPAKTVHFAKNIFRRFRGIAKYERFSALFSIFGYKSTKSENLVFYAY
jgi:hypothetical protein